MALQRASSSNTWLLSRLTSSFLVAKAKAKAKALSSVNSSFLSITTTFQAAASQDHSSSSSAAAPATLMAQPDSNGITTVTRVLFCGLHFPASFNFTKEYLSQYPFIQVDAIPHEEIPSIIERYDMCIPIMMRLDETIISRATRLKLILQYGVGLEGVDIDAATKMGIKVARIPSHSTGNSLSCAEHAIYLVLGLLRDQKAMERSVRKGCLGEPIGETLFGKTVYIVGYGNIGKDLAVRLKPFGVKIIATRRSWGPNSCVELKTDITFTADDFIDEKGGIECQNKFASQADIVVVCTTLNPETVGMINASFLSYMKKGAFLVNVARGGLLDYKAVKVALESGHLGGLGMDVAWYEPFDPEDPIVQHPKVLVTPHVAGVTTYSYTSMGKSFAGVWKKYEDDIDPYKSYASPKQLGFQKRKSNSKDLAVVGDCAVQLHKDAPLAGIEIVN